MPTHSDVVNVRALSIRLEDANSSERIEALEELQRIARDHPRLVCQEALSRVLQVLHDQGSSEEYSGCLYVLDALIRVKEPSVKIENANQLMSEASTVELFLDLLEHANPSIGVMTSQILSELHEASSARLEALIQQCPEGMNKLLQRLPDSSGSREAVRNQALVLIQQLTCSNEEMMTTVVFNEGLDVLFGIIQKEYDDGRDSEHGVVVQDCLQVCRNILQGSACQRFFYGNGTQWPLRLAYFFDPACLENAHLYAFDAGAAADAANGSSAAAAADSEYPREWFLKPGSVACATLALSTLATSLTPATQKHQNLLGVSLSGFIPAVAFCLVRNGPLSLVDGSLGLLEALVSKNSEVSKKFFEAVLTVMPGVPGETIPKQQTAIPTTKFGWHVLSNDAAAVAPGGPSHVQSSSQTMCITVLSLLIERYVYGAQLWVAGGTLDPPPPSPYPATTTTTAASNSSSGNDKVQYGSQVWFRGRCLQVLQAALAADPMGCDLIIQHVVAPPLPMPDQDSDSFPLDGAGGFQDRQPRPVGGLLLADLLKVFIKLSAVQSQSQSLPQPQPQPRAGGASASQGKRAGGEATTAATAPAVAALQAEDVAIAERVCNIMCLIFIHGRSLARELATVITVGHIFNSSGMREYGGGSSGSSGSSGGSTKTPAHSLSLLSFLLKFAEMAHGANLHTLAACLFRLLACITCNCEAAARLALHDLHVQATHAPTPASAPAAAVQFPLNLACASSASPMIVQVAVCLFVGNCLTALPLSADNAPSSTSTSKPTSTSPSPLSRNWMILLADETITLARLSDVLRRVAMDAAIATTATASLHQANANAMELYVKDSDCIFCGDFQTFYVEQLSAIRFGIFSFYSVHAGLGVLSDVGDEGREAREEKKEGGSGGGNNSSKSAFPSEMNVGSMPTGSQLDGDPQMLIITLQKKKIEKLEAALLLLQAQHTADAKAAVAATGHDSAAHYENGQSSAAAAAAAAADKAIVDDVLKQLQEDAQIATEAHTALEIDLRDTRDECTRLFNELEQCRNTVVSLTGQLGQSEEERKELERLQALLERDAIAMRDAQAKRGDAFKAELFTIQQELARKTHMVDKLERELGATLTGAAEARRDLEEFVSASRDVERELLLTQDKVADLETKLVQAQTQAQAQVGVPAPAPAPAMAPAPTVGKGVIKVMSGSPFDSPAPAPAPAPAASTATAAVATSESVPSQAQAQAQVQGLLDQNSYLQQALSSAQQQCGVYEASVSELTEQLASASRDVRDLTGRLLAKEEEGEDVIRKCNEQLQQQYQAHEQRVQDFTFTFDAQIRDVYASANASADAQAAASASAAEAQAQAQAQTAIYAATIRELETELQETQRKLADARGSIARLEQALSAAEAAAAAAAAVPPPQPPQPASTSSPRKGGNGSSAMGYGDDNGPTSTPMKSTATTDILVGGGSSSAGGVPPSHSGNHFISPIAPAGPLGGVNGASSMTGLRYNAAAASSSTSLESTPQHRREIANLTAQISREKRQSVLLQEAHNDLLALLAQEEVELAFFRQALTSSGGEQAVHRTWIEAQAEVTRRYGAYVNLRENAAGASSEGDGDW